MNKLEFIYGRVSIKKYLIPKRKPIEEVVAFID